MQLLRFLSIRLIVNNNNKQFGIEKGNFQYYENCTLKPCLHSCLCSTEFSENENVK